MVSPGDDDLSGFLKATMTEDGAVVADVNISHAIKNYSLLWSKLHTIHFFYFRLSGIYPYVERRQGPVYVMVSIALPETKDSHYDAGISKADFR